VPKFLDHRQSNYDERKIPELKGVGVRDSNAYVKVIEMKRWVWDTTRGVSVFQSERLVHRALNEVQKQPKRWRFHPFDV
jgi:hypothetical protein